MGLATWEIHRTRDADGVGVVCLHIELPNNHAVALTVRDNGDPPKCTLWRGNGKQDFAMCETFNDWLAAMQHDGRTQSS